MTELIVTPDMHRRKEQMAAMSDACVALPGGVGTLEERCHATIGGSTALTLHVGLGGESRLTKMDMAVDYTRKHITAVGIDLAVTAGAVKTSTCLCVFTFSDDVLYKAVFHNDGRATSLSFVDNYSVFYYQSHLID